MRVGSGLEVRGFRFFLRGEEAPGGGGGWSQSCSSKLISKAALGIHGTPHIGA